MGALKLLAEYLESGVEILVQLDFISLLVASRAVGDPTRYLLLAL